jgi:hypothetical protein
VFNDPAAKEAVSKHCLTLVAGGAGGVTWNLEALSAEQANAFLAGINSVLTGAGAQVVLEDAVATTTAAAGQRPAKGAKRFSILAPPSLPGVNVADPRSVVASSTSTAQPTVLGVASSEAIAALSEGRRFTRFSAGAGGAVSSAIVTVFYVKEQHALFWCNPGLRSQEPDSRLLLKDLTDVYLGRSAGVFKTNPRETGHVQTNRAISLRSKGHGGAAVFLDLEADSVEALSAFLYGLQTVLSKSGKHCYVDTDNSNQQAGARHSGGGAGHAGGVGAGAGKRFSILGSSLEGVEASRHAHFKKSLLTLPGDETVRLMTSGSEFTVYYIDPASGVASKARMHVFYAPAQAALFYCEPGMRTMDNKRKISLHALKDIFCGKVSRILKLPIAAAAEKGRCVTLASSGAELNLEADSVEQMTALLSGLNYLLNSNGMQVLIDDSAAASAASASAAGADGAAGAGSSQRGGGERRYSIMPYSKPAELPRTAQETMLALVQGTLSPAATEANNVRTTINMMAQGRRFVRYTLSKPASAGASTSASGDIHKSVVNLFYSKSNNALYWCAPTVRSMDDASSSIKLSNLRRVLLGKQTPTLRHPALAEVPNTKCVALTDALGTELNVAAETAEILSAWLFGLQTLVTQRSGKRAVVDTQAAQQVRPAGAASLSKPSSLPSSAQDTVLQLAARRPTLIGLSDSATLGMMGQGMRFSLWTQGTLVQGGRASKKDVLLFFENHAFWWTERVDKREEILGQSLPLASLTDVFLVGDDSKHSRTLTRVYNCYSAFSPDLTLTLLFLCLFLFRSFTTPGQANARVPCSRCRDGHQRSLRESVGPGQFVVELGVLEQRESFGLHVRPPEPFEQAGARCRRRRGSRGARGAEAGRTHGCAGVCVANRHGVGWFEEHRPRQPPVLDPRIGPRFGGPQERPCPFQEDCAFPPGRPEHSGDGVGTHRCGVLQRRRHHCGSAHQAHPACVVPDVPRHRQGRLRRRGLE